MNQRRKVLGAVPAAATLVLVVLSAVYCTAPSAGPHAAAGSKWLSLSAATGFLSSCRCCCRSQSGGCNPLLQTPHRPAAAALLGSGTACYGKLCGKRTDLLEMDVYLQLCSCMYSYCVQDRVELGSTYWQVDAPLCLEEALPALLDIPLPASNPVVPKEAKRSKKATSKRR